MTIDSFLKLNPPIFSGNPLIDDPQLFIDYINKALRILRCPSDKVVELAAYNLHDLAEQWYETLLEARNASGLPSLQRKSSPKFS